MWLKKLLGGSTAEINDASETESRATRGPDLFLNPERTIESTDALGRIDSSFAPTYDYGRPFINAYHESLANAPLNGMGIPVCINIGIDGYLQRGDAAKIYELAYFCDGDVLELGTHKGLSTSIIARALHDSGGGRTLTTVDIDKRAAASAKRTISKLRGAGLVEFKTSDATAGMDELIQTSRRFGLVFVDHWHGYDATHQAATRLPQLLTPGGLVMFHDYNDPDNANPEHMHKVFQAVGDTLVKDSRFRFCTISGCVGVFQLTG